MQNYYKSYILKGQSKIYFSIDMMHNCMQSLNYYTTIEMCFYRNEHLSKDTNWSKGDSK